MASLFSLTEPNKKEKKYKKRYQNAQKINKTLKGRLAEPHQNRGGLTKITNLSDALKRKAELEKELQELDELIYKLKGKDVSSSSETESESDSLDADISFRGASNSIGNENEEKRTRLIGFINRNDINGIKKMMLPLNARSSIVNFAVYYKGNKKNLSDNKIKKYTEQISFKEIVNSPDKEGNTPLWIAAKKGNLEIMDLLLKGGADVNTKNRMGEPLLVHVIDDFGEECLKTVKLLLEYKVDVNLKRKG